MAFIALVVILSSCKTQTVVQKSETKVSAETKTAAGVEALDKVVHAAQDVQFVTSKIKLNLQMGDKAVSLGGKLYMKRDDVIRLQLTALGLFEAGRVEFTKDYVLVVDRLNKQYIKVDYGQVDFLHKSGLSFYALQALFWNELFVPGKTGHVTSDDVERFDISVAPGGGIDLKMTNGGIRYDWTASDANGQISRFVGAYVDSRTGNVSVDWAYNTFKPLDAKPFPTQNNIKITTPKKNVSVNLQLNNISNDGDWETRTSVAKGYKQVSFEEIVKKLSAF